MSDKLQDYKRAEAPIPAYNRVWPLYGAGFENLGLNNAPIDVPMPQYGPDELLVRHDACGLCFSDIKVIKLGEEHPRIYRNMQENPVVLGHEVTMTVVGVGENLRDQYKVGDRFIIQADIYVDGVGFAYGYEIQGGLSHYGVIDQRVLDGDEGNYLMPVEPTTGYAQTALVEPWACVIAAYRLDYRTALKPGGTAWVIGTDAAEGKSYSLDAGFNEESHPDQLWLTNVPASLASDLKTRAKALGVQVTEVDLANPPEGMVDDIILLGADPDIVEQASPKLANFGFFVIVDDKPMPRKVQLDVGRIHYNRWIYAGTTTGDIAKAYSDVPVRSELKAGGKAWFIGAAGPMGRMHVQRAIEMANGPTTIICTDVSDHRLNDLYESYAEEAKAKNITFICENPSHTERFEALMQPYRSEGFDDIVVLAPVAALISDAAKWLAPQGVMNIFAGVARGTMAELDVSDVYLKNVRYIGQSGSLIQDMRITLEQAQSGQLSTNRSVAAVGSLSAVKDGLMAVRDGTFPGKVVIYPHIKELPLTPITELKDKLPNVYALLKNGHEWTVEAEAEFLREMLP